MTKIIIDLLKAIVSFDPKQLLKTGLTVIGLVLVFLIGLFLISIPLFLILRIDPVVFVQSAFTSSRAGLIDFAPRVEELYGERLRRLDAAQNEILFVGVTLYRSPQETKKAITGALQRGVKIRMLIADPYGQWYSANASMFGQTADDLRTETLNTIRGYSEIAQSVHGKADYNQGSLELRLIDRVFPNAFYFYDPADAGGSLIMVARSFDLNSPEMPGFHFAKTAGGVLDPYFASCKQLWDAAEKYEVWETRHP